MHSNAKIWLHARWQRCWIWDQAVGHNHTADFKYGKQYFPNLLNYLVCHSDENKRGMSKDERRKGVVRMIELSWRKKDERDLRLYIHIKPVHLDENNSITSKWFFGEILKGKKDKQYLFFKPQLVVYGRFLCGLYFNLLCWCPVWRVAVSQVAHSWIRKLEFFVPWKQITTSSSNINLEQLRKVVHS